MRTIEGAVAPFAAALGQALEQAAPDVRRHLAPAGGKAFYQGVIRRMWQLGVPGWIGGGLLHLRSGVHEMAISVPVRAGFGLPLLYFLLHGALVLVERARARDGHPLHGWIGRTWALFWLAAPLPILFHERFLAGIVWPLIGIPAG